VTIGKHGAFNPARRVERYREESKQRLWAIFDPGRSRMGRKRPIVRKGPTPMTLEPRSRSRPMCSHAVMYGRCASSLDALDTLCELGIA
jgi:hypothetical protein